MSNPYSKFLARAVLARHLSPLAIVALLLCAACSPSINPKLKTSVDSKLAMVQNSSETYSAESAPAGYEAGQWLQYKLLDENGRPTLMTYKLLAVLDGGYAVETVSESYYSRDVNYIEFQYTLGAPIDTMKIVRVISSKGDDAPKEMDGMSLSIMDSVYKNLAGQIFMSQTGAPGGASVSVPAGTFASCSEMDTTLSLGPWSIESHTWHHPAVPMHGMVKSERTDGKPGSSELLTFSLTGAQSEILSRL